VERAEDRDAASTVRDGGSKSGGCGTRRTSFALAGIKKSETSFSWIESLQNHERDRFQMLRAGCGRKIGFYFSSSRSRALTQHWKHMIEKESLKFKELEQVLIENIEQFFRDLL
jgi:hypothetical protein